MTRRVIAGLVGGLSLGSLAFAALPDWVQWTPAGTPAQTVPFNTIRQVADRRAQTMWSKTEPGDVVPLVDVDGNELAYMFHYRIDGQAFPDYATAASEINAELPLLDNSTHHSHYAHVLASARYDRAPILRYGEGGTEYFITLEQARDRVRPLLAGDPVLTRVYYVWPLSYYEFSAGTSHVVIEAHTFTRTFSTREEFIAYVHSGERQAWNRISAASGRDDEAAATAECALKMQAEWNHYLTDAGAFDTTTLYVPNPDAAPFYDWSYGCSPTSGTMVLGYCDAARGSGRCIYDFFQRWDGVEREEDYQIPWAQREVALDFQTDTSSGGTYPANIGPGLQQFLSDHGYSFDVFSDDNGNYYNDWLWCYDSSEINDGWPMVWSCSWETHSLAAFGCRWYPENKDMYVHNTWWRPAEWWHYSDGSHLSSVEISSVHCISSDPSLRLTMPRGDTLYNHNGSGEILWGGRSNRVQWDNAGVPNDSLTIDLTTDGGWTWQNLAHGVPDSGYYTWTIPPGTPSTSNRLRVKAFASGAYLSGDGSYGNFKIAVQPLPPTLLSPPSGRVLTAPPVVLIVDTEAFVDSYNFEMWHNSDTLFQSTSTSPICSLPTSLFRYGNLYAWHCRARNSTGWGDFSNSSGFWVRWAAVEEGDGAGNGPLALDAAGLSRSPIRVLFNLPKASRVNLDVFDILGRPVRRLYAGECAIGPHEAVWNLQDERGRGLSGGCYFVTLRTGDRVLMKKVELVE